MSVWSDLRDYFMPRSRQKMSIDDWWQEFGPSNRSSGGIAVTQVSALQIATVMACVQILSEDVAKLPIHVYEQPADKNKPKTIQTKHPVERLLITPNNWQTRFEFIEMMQSALLLRGNAYACIVRDFRGNPTMLVPMNPDRVWIFEAPGGEIYYSVARRGLHDMAMLKSLPLMVHSDDMFHLRWLAVDNSLYGVSRIQLQRESMGLALSQQELAGRISANSTNLGGVLTTDQRLTEPAAKRLSTEWEKLKGGLANAGKTAVLEQGLKWQPLGMTAQDAQFIAQREHSVLELARVFRVPPHKLGVMDGVGRSVEQLDQDYMNNTISSYVERWEAKLSQCFGLADEGLSVEFDVARFLRASMQTRLTALRTGVAGGIYKPNEARRAEGLPDVDGGDILYMPANLVPLGTPPSGLPGPGSDITQVPADGGDGDAGANPEDNPDQAPPG